MPTIDDKFGKSSVDSDYAIATTVKTTRTAGTTVLEAFDLSKFPADTPVFFVTYKKETNPLTDEVTVTDLVSWKALVNTGANTLTNLTVAPGYTDAGNAIGDFIECIPTSYWENSLIDGIRTSIDDDGTLKTSAVQEALNLSGAIPPDYTVLAVAPNTITALGNRSYSLVYNAIDYTDRLNPGTRLRSERTVAAPTQCTDLESGSSQYYSKTSPAGMTFTDDFVVSAWVKLESYAAMSIASRYNGTSGWTLDILATGQVQLVGLNGGAANNSYVLSYQSIPLGKWVHIAAQLDMSTFTATTTTSYVMIDGVDVPASVVRGGTNPTALIQAGNLEIGGRNGGLQPFDGKLAQVAIYSAKVTQATILASMNQTLSGTETSLISAYSFNNTINDLNANANNLTANGSAVATNADSPFGGQASGLISSTIDYGIIQSAVFSTNTTIIVQVPEGCTLPTTGGITSTSYSSMKAPYEFPTASKRYRLSTLLRISTATTSNAAYGAFISGGFALNVPIGGWDVGWQAGCVLNGTTTSVYFNISPTALTGLGATAVDLTYAIRTQSPSAAAALTSVYLKSPQSVTTQSTYVMYTLGSTTTAGILADGTMAEIFAENAYL